MFLGSNGNPWRRDRGHSGCREGSTRERRAVKRLLKSLLAVTVIAGLAGGVVYLTKTEQAGKDGGWRAKGGSKSGSPVAVVVAPARVLDVPVYLDGVGTVRARNTVTVRPQVDGRIMAIEFKEGQDVKRGDVLARIDPSTYQAQLDQVVARKRLSEVQLDNARRDLSRLTRLTTSAVAEKTVDTQRAQVAQLEAQIKADEAAIENAKAFLAYTTITSPLDGRTGMRLADAGNLVRGSDTGIVVVSELKPISVLFTLPQQQLQQVIAAFAKGPLKAEALDNANKTVIDTGTLMVVDNAVDSQTGTVKLKAEFANADLKLWPGQFVNVRLLVDTLKETVAVPSPAIQRGPSGPFVYVLQPDNTVRLREIAIGQTSDAAAVVAKGLAAGEHVVTSGFSRLSDGSAVTPSVADDARPSEPAAQQPDTGVSAAPAGPHETGSTGEARAEGAAPRQKGEGRRGRRKDANASKPAATP
jgi:multidrug efflux system membrane fusion protein